MIGWIAAGAGLAFAGTVTYGVFVPRSRLFGRVIWRVDGKTRRIALTFDDGPSPTGTPAVLDILAEHRVPAAFFVIGRNVEQNPDLLRRAHDEGHLICNHSHGHDRMGAFGGYGYWRREVTMCNEAVERAIGVQPALFRPPMGLKTPRITVACRRQGMKIVTWSRGGRDGVRSSPDAIVRRIVPRCSAGDILMLHDGVEPGRERDVRPLLEALPRIIREIRGRGLDFERLDRLMGQPGFLPVSLPLR